MNIILKRPIISEKSMVLAKSGLYTFEVAKNARKEAILKATKALFGVDVVSVKTVNIKGLRKQQRNRRGYFETSAIKKAYIQVKAGQKIAVFESMTTPQEEVTVTSGEGEPVEVKEKKSLLKGTKVKIEKTTSAKKKGAKK